MTGTKLYAIIVVSYYITMYCTQYLAYEIPVAAYVQVDAYHGVL